MPDNHFERISSRQNALFKSALKLADSARERSESRSMLLEGTRLVAAYGERFGLQDAILLVDEEAIGNASIQGLLEARARKVYVLAHGLFRDVSQIGSPEGLSAIARIPQLDPPEADVFRIYLDGVQEPGNLGNLLRTASAAGATSAWLSRGCADPWSPKCLRGGMGAQFLLPLRLHVEPSEALKGFPGQTLATSPDGHRSLYDLDLTGPVTFLFGSEGRGLSEAALALTTDLVRIPMYGGVESLNVGTAAAVCCFERVRQLGAGR